MTDKKFNINLHKKQQLKMLVRRIMQVTGLMEHTADRLVRIALKSGFKDTDKDFFFKNYPEIKKKVDKIIEELHDNICMEVEEGDKEQWLLSAEKNDAMVAGMIGSTRLPKGTIESWNQRNLDALEAFRKRADKGMGLSGRVWNITDQFYQEVELALEMGLGEGKSADVLSREVRKYLKEPHKLFRRVRDEKGNLRLSKAAKAYHPGRGVYRSSYQNAIRMTGTENNMAYRSADHERWNQIPFVIGIEVGLSNNHNCKGVPRGTFYDICDELKGVYPKDFKFVGWHPRCRCHATAKLADMDDFCENQRQKMSGEDVSDYKFQGEVKEMPKCFGKWMDKNRERVEGAKNLPYFIRDNKKVIGWSSKKGTTGFKMSRKAKKETFSNMGTGDYLGFTSYTNAQIENFKEVERVLGIKRGKPMTFKEADEMKANIFKFNDNCVPCVIANELRRRGFDVTSLSFWEELSDHTNMAWLTEKGTLPQIQTSSGRTFDIFKKDIEKKMSSKEGVRYTISWDIDKDDGHIIVAERVNGEMRLFDPQKNDFYSLEEIYTAALNKNVFSMRIDNALINPLYIAKIVTAMI